MRTALSVLAFLVAVAALVVLLALHHLFARGPLPLGVQVAAVGLMLWARATFGLRSFHASAGTTGGGLVTSGPYRFLRHPIYASIVWFAWAGQVRAPSPRALAATGVLTLALAARALLEESFLRAEYPEYAEYARQARLLIPYVV